MKFKLGFSKILPKPKRVIQKLSPQEKFNRIARKLSKSKIKLRKYHFNAIEAGKTLIVFDGEGNEVFQGENSVKGCRVARQHCLMLFFSAEDQNGGYSFTTNVNYEFQSLEEIKQVNESIKRLMDYQPFAKYVNCTKCNFQFESEKEMKMHVCTDNWIVFEFPKPQKRIYTYATQ